MATAYRLSPIRRAVNALVHVLLRAGVGPPRTCLPTVCQRRTGQPRSTPVTLVETGGQRCLVAPYGAVSWVHNARAAGHVTLSRGRRSETAVLEELGPAESAKVLRQYVREVPITRPFFDAGPGAPLEAFAVEAPRHPVFRIMPGSAASESTRATPGRSA